MPPPPNYSYNFGPPRSNYVQGGGGPRFTQPPPWRGGHYTGVRSRGQLNFNRGRGQHGEYPEWWRPNHNYDSFQKPPYQDPYDASWEYNLPTQNRFFPLSDANPCDDGLDSFGAYGHQQNVQAPSTSYFTQDVVTPNYTVPTSRGSGTWGFSRSGQGLKRPVEKSKELEGGGACEQKRART